MRSDIKYYIDMSSGGVQQTLTAQAKSNVTGFPSLRHSRCAKDTHTVLSTEQCATKGAATSTRKCDCCVGTLGSSRLAEALQLV